MVLTLRHEFRLRLGLDVDNCSECVVLYFLLLVLNQRHWYPRCPIRRYSILLLVDISVLDDNAATSTMWQFSLLGRIDDTFPRIERCVTSEHALDHHFALWLLFLGSSFLCLVEHLLWANDWASDDWTGVFTPNGRRILFLWLLIRLKESHVHVFVSEKRFFT